MPAASSPSLTALLADVLDVLAEARNAVEGLREVDRFRRLIAQDSVFSIQQNVTTSDDPADEIRLRRLWSSEAQKYPVNGTKRKTLTPWTECLFIQGRVFIGEGADLLARTFDDYDRMRADRLQSVVNVPLLQGNVCYATFNVFGRRARWLPDEVLGIRLLALAAARWVPPAPGLAYRFTGVNLAASQEV